MTDTLTDDYVPQKPPSSGWTVPTRAIVSLGGLWFVLALPSATNTSPGFFETIGLFFFGSAIGLAWLIMTLCNTAVSSSLWWWTVPAAPVLSVLLCVTNVGLLVRMKVSERQLDEYVKQYGHGEHRYDDHRVGLFTVDLVESSNGAVYLHTSREFMDSTGIAYLPPGCQRHPGYQVLNHLCGDWYRFYWEF